MPTLINTLFPPQVATFMPAFVNTTDAVIYFTYSPLNDDTLVKKVHLSLVNQTTNENALADTTGVLIYEADTSAESNAYSVGYDTVSGMYYVVIPRRDLKNASNFNINQFYKVQLRLDSTDGGRYDNVKNKAVYLAENQYNFSEWSTVCLIRPILEPHIELRSFSTDSSANLPSFNKGIIPISGQLFFGDGNSLETETLQSYQLQIYVRDSTTLLIESEWIYTGDNINPNDINYKFDIQGIDSNQSQLTLRVNYITQNQYSGYQDYDFNLLEYVDMDTFSPVGVNEDPMDQTIRVKVDEEGRASFTFTNIYPVYGTLYIKRSSSLTGFKIWESISETNVNDVINMTITDNTIGSHLWYRYSIQLENSAGGLSPVYYTEKFFTEFYDAFLSRLDQQFTIRYDFKISNMKPVVNRSKVDTLGGKYPKFTENAVLNYKQFSISGLISSEADYNQVFLNKRNYYGDDYLNYEIYKKQDGLEDVVRNDSENWDQIDSYLTTTANDYFWEREFREAALAWLNDGEPKLFRSAQEGVLAVMLTDVTLTPRAGLNRRIYDFSATMYEVADGNSLATLDSIGIVDLPKIEQTFGRGVAVTPPTDYRTLQLPGQVYLFNPIDDDNIITTGKIYHQVADRYLMGGIYSDRECYDFYIKNVRIYFHNDPHMFAFSNGNISLVTNPSSTQLANQQIQLGYSFRLQTTGSAQWSTIFVNAGGYYQVPLNLDVTGLAFNQYATDQEAGDLVTVEYIVVYKERTASKEILSGTSIQRTLVGQEYDVFKPEQYWGERIRQKYNYVTETYIQRMIYFRGISVDVTPYAVLHLQYQNDIDYKDYIVGPTGVLNLLSKYPINDLCFLGRRMTKCPIERQKYLEEWEYVRSDVSAATTADIINPIYNTVYSIGGQDKIYYQDQWWDFEETDDYTGIAAVNVEGTINYLGDVIRSTY